MRFDVIELLGWLAAGGGGLLLIGALWWHGIALVWRCWFRMCCTVDMAEAAREWRRAHPDKTARYDRNWRRQR